MPPASQVLCVLSEVLCPTLVLQELVRICKTPSQKVANVMKALESEVRETFLEHRSHTNCGKRTLPKSHQTCSMLSGLHPWGATEIRVFEK
jgi:hypothetical protein